MAIQPLDTPQASAQYDAEKQVVWITYRGILDADATRNVYTWLGEFFNANDKQVVLGEVFDFREVQSFGPDNLFEARKKSRGFNLKQDISHLPVSMICANFYQEEILRGPMQNVPENPRKQIVRNEVEALQFITNWHKQQQPESPS